MIPFFKRCAPLFFLLLIIGACEIDIDEPVGQSPEADIQLMTLNPGHFHAALVQREMVEGVDSTVYIYAPDGPDLDLHLQRIENFNSREVNPTAWRTEIYTGEDYLTRMLDEQPGNVMVTAGNNQRKTSYIRRAVSAGIHVLSDKPMAIDSTAFEQLLDAFDDAERQNILLYDIMPERHEVTSRLKRELAQRDSVFGELLEGNQEEPAIEKESVYHLFKYVDGEPLQRPPWYFDVEQQGEGIADVTTHLVDLSMWTPFPDRAFDYQEDVQLEHAERWPTDITRQQFENITGEEDFPEYLNDHIEAGQLSLYSNGEIHYLLDDHYVRIRAQWDYEAPEGGDDMYSSVLRGTRSDLIIRQGEEQDYHSTLYVEPVDDTDRNELADALQDALDDLQEEFPGVALEETEYGWQLDVPEELHLGHETHFSRVAQTFFDYVREGSMPEWERSNMKSKYYITTHARELAHDAEESQDDPAP